MHGVAVVAGTIGIISTFIVLGRVCRDLRGTTLVTAWRWGLAGVTLWAAAWLFNYVTPVLGPGIVDQLWYLAALVILCAAIAVLGAKIPASRVWGWFIVLPLVVVLGWPALYVWGEGWSPRRLILPEPAFVAVIFVCVMGFGNYLGTCYAPSAALLAAAVMCIVAPLAASAPRMLGWQICTPLTATILLTAAAWGGLASRRLARRRSRLGTCLPLDRVWRDFRDYYGVVWGRRIQDRFNASAEKSAWAARLGPDGFQVPPSPPTGSQSTLSSDELRAMETTLRWLLRRFVSREWIDRRMSA